MSHITTAPRTERVAFDALPRLHTRNVSSGSFDGMYEYDDNSTQRHERRYDSEDPSYERRHYDGSIGSSSEEEGLPKYGSDRSWSRRGTDYTQVPTGYKPDMITYSETTLDVAPEIDRERPNYKPSALRWPFLTGLLLVVSTLVGLIVWALHVLPVLNNDLNVLTEGIRRREVQELSSYTVVRIAFTDARPILVHTPLGGRAENASDPTSSPTSEQTSPTAVATPAGDDFGHVGDQTITEPVGPTTTPPPAQDTTKPKADTTSHISTAYSKPEEDFGHVGGPVTISEEALTSLYVPGTSNYGDIGSKIVTETIPESNYGDVGSTSIYESVASTNHGGIGMITISETVPQTPTFITPIVTVATNSEGVTTTSTSIPEPISTPQTTTLTNSQGQPTATQETSVLVTPSVISQMDSTGKPTATETLYPIIPPPSDNSEGNNGNIVTKVYHINHVQYFIGSFLPTLLAIALAIPVRILDVNAKILQPWHELAHDRGASGRESLCLNTSGLQSIAASLRSLVGGQALVFLTTILVLASALLIPISAEAVKFDLRGIGCVAGSGNASNCAYVLSVFDQAAKATAALLALMGLATLMLILVLARWRSGISTNPWSICGTASLSLNPDVRLLFTSLPAGIDAGKMPKGLLESVLEDRWFKLGYFCGANGTVEYGVMLCENAYSNKYALGQIGGEEKEPQDHHAAPTKPKHHLPFLMLGYIGRGLFLFILCGLLGLILYYNNTGGDTAFERFMDSESFGVRFLFTAVGVIISFFWASFFSSIAILSPYQLLASSPQHARRSILLAPPTNAFSGLLSSVRRRHGFLAVVALTSILSEFLTIFLSNIPYRVTQTFLLHQVCTWSAVGILCIMVLVVLASFFITWPHMPVDPSTIAGAMYYVCDSWMLGRFEGLSILKRKDRDWRVNEMGLKYEFGEIRGYSGTARIGVDASSSSGV
ncbi:hypothetical protein F5Y00DRAFT_224340 [Daldinia vernicosa]|uniref:uncharacterized protein n=1 Tax=Daldinia vernicosa TaxID=114800 RepID=UPI002008304C|nr:uncharacterized protein F5Y00DRAFT_224340 [Daldinia vernicosa]KAI0854031.1 hypothetical protein F5Y00DRAFT_224340 [Daldinia vernicosa]